MAYRIDGMIANDLERVGRSHLLFETFVIPITHKLSVIQLRYVYMYIVHVNYKAHMACDLSDIAKNERVLKVTGSHVHFKSGSI